MSITREDLKQLPELLQGDLELRVELAQLILDEVVVARLMQRNPELRDVLRRIVLTEELLNLPQEFREFREETRSRLTNIEQDVAETKERVTRVEQDVAETKERVTRVEQDVAETKERVTRLEQTTESIQQTVIRLEQSVVRLESWQRGEQGRRDGEEYERRVVERAARLFGRGDGGSPRTNERVRKQVEVWLDQAGVLTEEVEPEYDPLVADLVWWKGDKVAVVEISIRVNGRDVQRVVKRAQTLRKAGLEVLPVVVGTEWAHPETKQLAEQAGVAWRIGNQVSESLIAYRQLSASP
ncbi:MAG: hypothetical protein ACK4RG_01685 [Fimbriimonadales bacterium]